jgi:hypothetical protein
MRILHADVRDVQGLPERLELGSVGVSVLHAGRGPAARRAVDAIVAAKERVGPYGIVGTLPWPAERGAANVTLAFAIDAEERDFAATESEVMEVTCRLGPAVGGPMERHDPGSVALLSRHAADAGRVERIGAVRSLDGAAPGTSLPSLRKSLCLSTHPKKLAGLPQLLIDAARDRSAVADVFGAALARLGATVDFRGTRVVAGRHELAFARKGRMEGLFDLGHDEQQLVLFAGFFACLPLSRSILFVEEPELHQGEDDVGPLVEGLVSLAGGNQLILTTRSRAVLRSVPDATIVHLGAD